MYILHETSTLRYTRYYQNIIHILGGAVTQVAKLVVQSVNPLAWHCWVSEFLACVKIINTLKQLFGYMYLGIKASNY